MKVLMFGWEFPPYISGGLGTACHGLTENLGRLGVEVVLVLPRAAAEAVRGQPGLAGVAETTRPAPRAMTPAATASVTAAPVHEQAVVAGPPDVRPASAVPPPATVPATPPAIPTIFTSPPTALLPALRLSHRTRALLLTIDSPLRPYLTVATYSARKQQALDAAAANASAAPPAPGGESAPATAAPAAPAAPTAPALTPSVASFPAPAPPPVEMPAPPPLAVPPPVRAMRPTLTTVSVGYGADLLREVSRYTFLGGEVGRSQEFDVIHVHDWMTFMAGVEAKLRSGKPLVVHVHSTEYDRNPEQPNRDICGIEQYGLLRADGIITVSWRTRELIVAKYGVDPARVVVVHNAAQAPPAASPIPARAKLPGIKTVLFLGRVTGQKGPDYFVEAARLVLQRLPRTRFVVAGAGDLLPAVIERVASHRLQQHFHFTGFLQGADLEAMFGISDLYVMPSLAEPFGITALEAVRRGVPVIVSRQAGVNEVLHHVTQVDPTDVADMAAKIIQMLTHGRQTRTQLARGQRELATLTWEGAAAQVLAVYEALVHGRPLATGTPPLAAEAPASPASDAAAATRVIADDADLPPTS